MKHKDMAAKRVLLVEDSLGVREVFAMCLQDAGYEVFQAEDGKEALLLAQTLRPHAVITDLQMPHMGGAELARTMKRTENLSEIPIGLITATPRVNISLFARVLIKPCSLEELLELANFLVSKRPLR